MMYRSVLVICLATVVCAAGAAPAPPEGPRQIRLAPQASAKQVGAFRYRLLPDPRDRTPGNAATLWRLAGDAARDVARPITVKENAWLGAGGTPLQRLPRKEVADFLAPYAGVFRLARQAACREYCNWEMPPLTLQSIRESFSNSPIQNYRHMINVLSIRYRLQLAEGRYSEASETLQIGFALAHHLGENDTTVILNLVGMAYATILLQQVEEWVQTPGSPNLYWALTALPRPLVNLRRPIEHELNTFHRSFPRLRRLRHETFTQTEAEDLVKEVFGILSKMADDTANPTLRKEGERFRKLGEAIRAGESYSQARKHLLDLGRPAKEIDAMPKAQAILLWYVDQYDRVRDDVLKAFTVPMWQAIPLMDAAFQEHHAADNAILTLLMPTLNKTWLASVRLERQIAGLRSAEAMRLYAAAHEGKPPEKWSDITAVPLPIDPLTGKGFDTFYQVTGGRGILEIPPPPPPGMPASLGRRYELTPR